MFFYGTLRHTPLLEIVLGKAPERLDGCPARLADHAVRSVPGEPFPTLIAAPGETAPGLLVRGLTEQDIARLRFYESGFDFDLVTLDVTDDDGTPTTAQVFFPKPGLWDTEDDWSLPDWTAKWAGISIQAAREVMAWHGRKTGAEIAAGFAGIRRRAAAVVAARNRVPDTVRDLAGDVTVLAHKRPYANFFAVEEMDLRVRRYDQRMGPVVNRAALAVGQAAVVLPYDPRLDTVLLVEQFRAPVFMAGDQMPWVWEPIAGPLEPGETAEEAARREALEEADLAFRYLEPAGEMYSSTGSSTEYLYLFIGVTDLPDTAAGLGGVDAGEDIRSAVIAFDELMQRVDDRLCRDMPLVTTALWLARHRDRLRSGQ
ncbi:NUDIX domain-containing protein [Sedimentitalea xiamensis]|uniref:NUDIX domain-containing protein n=1 Tax=Sedimentitalea xiamensis TaxID=3050037 RepID=UPI002AA29F37|nr:NUDIX domain-containing protein [Sedimentitalea xiamensis]